VIQGDRGGVEELKVKKKENGRMKEKDRR